MSDDLAAGKRPRSDSLGVEVIPAESIPGTGIDSSFWSVESGARRARLGCTEEL
jgi:hypothetical protein